MHLVPGRTLKILFLAPNPFFQERGTPLAIRLMLETLDAQGHEVDVLTYHEGETPAIGDVSIYRIPPPPFVRDVPIGFSWKKVVCDAYLGAALAWRLARKRYDVIHAVEESVYLASLAKTMLGTPFLYDMDSSLADQILENIPRAAPLGPFLHYMEKTAIRHADAVVPMCEALAGKARACAPEKPVHVIEDIAMGSEQAGASRLREEFGVRGPLLLYVGNLEAYQGIDLMLDAFADVVGRGLEGDLVVVGGRADHLEHYRARTGGLGLGDRVHWAGPRPIEQLKALLAQADVLLSPRRVGVNTPMKIYSYLAAGVPTVATRIESHTQVLDDEVAVLTDNDPKAYGDGIAGLLEDPARGAEIGRRARELAEAEYSREAFQRKVAALYGDLAG